MLVMQVVQGFNRKYPVQDMQSALERGDPKAPAVGVWFKVAVGHRRRQSLCTKKVYRYHEQLKLECSVCESLPLFLHKWQVLPDIPFT
jgi:hypothetical protein